MATWTDEIVERMKALWAEGLSASKVADILNGEFTTSYTRNSVIGKIHRLDIERNHHASPMARRYRRYHRSFGPKHPIPIPKATEAFMPANIPMIDRTDSQCPFPMWAHEESPGLNPIVCGSTKDACASYCDHHMKLTHNPKQPRTSPTIALRDGFQRQPGAKPASKFNFIDGEAA